jgi:xeroderma pigmentosum group C-complementing protein
VTGKLRIGREGINGTAAGSHAGIEAMRAELASESSHEPSLAAAAGGMDYKPAPGCACLFDDLSVRLVPEIVPFEPSANGGGGGGGRKAKAAKKKKGQTRSAWRRRRQRGHANGAPSTSSLPGVVHGPEGVPRRGGV